MTASTSRTSKRFFWVQVYQRGEWTVAQCAYSEPDDGFYIPGLSRIIQPNEVGCEIFPPVAFRAAQAGRGTGAGPDSNSWLGHNKNSRVDNSTRL